MGFIYLIKNIETSEYKIGKSINPYKRLLQLQTGNTCRLEIVHLFETKLVDKVEKALHNTYHSLKKEGEWFDLDLKIEREFMIQCLKIEMNFNYLLENSTYEDKSKTTKKYY